jgi:general secretion pathway protein A
MYLHFYGLREKPFKATPDPRFLYLTPAHREALAQLIYGVREGEGFIVLTGEVGTGKTTLLHTLLQRVDDKTAIAFVMNSTLPFDGLLEYMLEDWGVPVPGATRAQRLFALNRFLIERRRAGLRTVLIVDEAQNLSLSTLEQVRLLSNFETPGDKLLQIILVGQPELRTKLARPELRQLKQRISLRCAIRPLTTDETRDYLRSRLQMAGAADPELFSDSAVSRIADYTRGVPRLVNIVADHCLVVGYGDQERRVSPHTVERAVRYLEDEAAPTPVAHRGRWSASALWRFALGGLGAAAAAGAAVVALGVDADGRVGILVDQLLDLARGARDLVTR